MVSLAEKSVNSADGNVTLRKKVDMNLLPQRRVEISLKRINFNIRAMQHQTFTDIKYKEDVNEINGTDILSSMNYR